MASKAKVTPKKVAKKKNGYEMPKALKPGDVIEDNQKNKWKVGVSIGVGGFGEIYSACNVDSKIKNVKDYPYVVKIEPKENGPLFVEMHFYMRNAKLEDIEKFMKEQKMKSLGMPEYISSGSHEIEQLKHRFLVLPRFGKDIMKIFEENNRKFPLHTVYRLGLQILNVLQYIHSCTYVHADIKGSNILLGFGKGGDDRVHLLDYGLACHYNTKEFKPNPKKAHDGTIEYTSRDAHLGVPTMRGDIEVFAYNIIEWAGAQLPWVAKNILTKPVEVQKMKEDFMKNYEKSLRSSFGSISVPLPISELFKYLASMKPDTQPDYSKIRGFFEAGLKDLGKKNLGTLEFDSTKASTTKAKAAAASPKKGGRSKPDFSFKDVDDEKLPGPSKPSGRGRAAAVRKHVENDSDEEQAASLPTKKTQATKKTTTAKQAEKEPLEKPERAGKRNRVRKQYVEESDSESEAPPAKSPKKRGKVQEESLREASESPPKKKSKEKPLQPESSELETGSGKSTITLKAKSDNKKNKTITLNFNLDVSMNSDVVVVLNRKDKKKTKDDEKKSEGKNVSTEKDENEPLNDRDGFYKGKHAKK